MEVTANLGNLPWGGDCSDGQGDISGCYWPDSCKLIPPAEKIEPGGKGRGRDHESIFIIWEQSVEMSIRSLNKEVCDSEMKLRLEAGV